MTKRDLHRAELRELATKLARPAAEARTTTTANASGDQPGAEAALDVEKLLRELQGKLSEAVDDVEDIVRAHPLAAVASALLLGIVIGRMMGRR
jgi:ElaB/YqjD/DUF883 family membrane-anchored ribosome-binding protein